MSVVKLEICWRIPSRCASAVVRSARVCFSFRLARRIEEAAAPATESATQAASTVSPGREGWIRTVSPSTTKRAFTARARQRSSVGSTAFASRSASNAIRKRVPVRVEANELREPLRRQRADVLALERQCDRGRDELPRLGEGSLRRLGRQLRVDVAKRRLDGTLTAQDGRPERGHEGGAGRSGRLAETARRRSIDTCARFGSGSLRSSFATSSSIGPAGTSTGFRASVGGDGSARARTRVVKESRPRSTAASAVAPVSIRRTVRGSTEYRCAPTRTAIGSARPTSRTATPGSGRSQ